MSQELEWGNLSLLATDVMEIPRGVRVQFAAVRYGEVADLVSRELACCGSWLELGLVRMGSQIYLIATSTTPEGVEVIRNTMGITTA